MTSTQMCSFNGPATTSFKEVYTSSFRTVKITHQWCVTNYASSQVPIDGPIFSVAHSRWHLRVYPHGKSQKYREFVSISAVSANNFHIEDGNLRMYLEIDGHVIKTAGKRLPSYLLTDMEVSFPDFVSNIFTFPPNSSFKIECRVDMKYLNGSILEDTMKPAVSSVAVNLERLFEDKSHSDVVVIAGGKEVRAHRAVLAAQSPIFAAMFENETAEELYSRVEIPDVQYEVLHQMMRFIYTGNTPHIDLMTWELLVAANKYQLFQLKTMCESAILCHLPTEMAATTFILADRHGARELKAGTASFIIEHAEEVMKTIGWTLMVHDYPLLVAELFSAATTSRNNLDGAR